MNFALTCHSGVNSEAAGAQLCVFRFAFWLSDTVPLG